MSNDLTLYHTAWCGYCHRVRSYAAELGIPLKLVEIDRDPAALERLMKSRGRRTVPVLGIPGESGEKLLGESRDIMRFLKERSASLS